MIEKKNRVIPIRAAPSGSDNIARYCGLHHSVVWSNKPDLLAGEARIKAIRSHSMAPRIAVAPRQRRNRDLSRSAFDLPARTQSSGALHSPNQRTRVPNRVRRMNWPVEWMRSGGPNGHIPAIGARHEVGPDQIVERAGQEMTKNGIGDLHQFVRIRRLDVYVAICR